MCSCVLQFITHDPGDVWMTHPLPISEEKLMMQTGCAECFSIQMGTSRMKMQMMHTSKLPSGDQLLLFQ